MLGTADVVIEVGERSVAQKLKLVFTRMIEMGKADAVASLDGLLFYVGFFFSLLIFSSETVLLLISFHKTCKQGRVGNVAKACASCQLRGKTDGAPRPGGKAWLGVCWSWIEVVWVKLHHLNETGSSSGVPFFEENATVFSSGAGEAHQAQEGWGVRGRVFRGSLASERVTVLMERLERRTRGSSWRDWWSSRGT